MKSLRTARLTEMEEYIIEHEHVRLDTLAKVFNISLNTVRRDIDEIIQNGKVSKVYGGVTSNVQPNKLISYNIRYEKQAQLKDIIAKKASSFIQDNDTIFLDSGSTTVHIMKYISHVKDLIVVTNNMAILEIYKNNIHENMKLILLPGEYNLNTNSIVGGIPSNYMLNYNFSKCFMAATALSSSGDVTNSSVDEFQIKKNALLKSDSTFLLIDSSKYDNASFLTYANIAEFNYIVSDKAPADYINLYSKSTNFIIA
ncbi:MAG: DeoR/GlpR family DNA-binding transcription regulator [Tissierellaceae bacterium]